MKGRVKGNKGKIVHAHMSASYLPAITLLNVAAVAFQLLQFLVKTGLLERQRHSLSVHT